MRWQLTERLLSEKYFKKLIGNKDNKTDIENALKRLDRLTDEEAQMAAAQVLKATDTIVDFVDYGTVSPAARRSNHNPIRSAQVRSYAPTTTRSGTNYTSTPHRQKDDLILALA